MAPTTIKYLLTKRVLATTGTDNCI